MQLYVEKLPQCCAECQFCYFKDGCGYCLAKFLKPTKPLELGGHVPYLATNKDCPLKSIYGPISQAKKMVCEEFNDRFLANCKIECGNDTASFSLEVLNRILNQIQGEDK